MSRTIFFIIDFRVNQILTLFFKKKQQQQSGINQFTQ